MSPSIPGTVFILVEVSVFIVVEVSSDTVNVLVVMVVVVGASVL